MAEKESKIKVDEAPKVWEKHQSFMVAKCQSCGSIKTLAKVFPKKGTRQSIQKMTMQVCRACYDESFNGWRIHDKRVVQGPIEYTQRRVLV